MNITHMNFHWDVFGLCIDNRSRVATVLKLCLSSTFVGASGWRQAKQVSGSFIGHNSLSPTQGFTTLTWTWKKSRHLNNPPTKPEKLRIFTMAHTQKKWGGFQIYSSPTLEYMDRHRQLLSPQNPLSTPGSGQRLVGGPNLEMFNRKRRFSVSFQVWCETIIYMIFNIHCIFLSTV